MPKGRNDIVSLKTVRLLRSKAELETLPKGKLLINTINAFSYNNARKDRAFIRQKNEKKYRRNSFSLNYY